MSRITGGDEAFGQREARHPMSGRKGSCWSPIKDKENGSGVGGGDQPQHWAVRQVALGGCWPATASPGSWKAAQELSTVYGCK